MESPRFRLLPLLGASLLLLLPLLGARAQEDAELQPRALDIYSAVEDASHEKELVGIPYAPDSPGLPRGPFLCTRLSSLPSSAPPFPESGRGEMNAKSGLPSSSKDLFEPHRLPEISRISCPGSSERHEPQRLWDPWSVSGTALAKFPPLLPPPPEHHFCQRSPRAECVWFWGSL